MREVDGAQVAGFIRQEGLFPAGVGAFNKSDIFSGIGLVDFINKLRKEGHDRRASLVTAGMLRLRPVLMTTITTVGGLASVAYGIGGSDPFLKPMGLALIWGLTFSTILTLIFIPCVYAIIDDLVLKVMHRSSVRDLKDKD